MRFFAVFAVFVGATQAAQTTYNAGRKKPNVGFDIDLNGMYHPWDKKDDNFPAPDPSSPQYRIAEYMMQNVKVGDTMESAIAKLEAYSDANHLGMTLGDQKGQLIEGAVWSYIGEFSHVRDNAEDLIFFEFGSHIGDGTLRLLKKLNELFFKGRCIVFSFEANQEWLGIGSTLVRHVLQTTYQRKCQYIPMALTDDISHIVDNVISEYDVKVLAGTLLDHNHAKFMRDMSILLDKHLLADGTLIMADNALRHKNLMSQFIERVRLASLSFRLADVSDPYPDQLLIASWRNTTQAVAQHSDEL